MIATIAAIAGIAAPALLLSILLRRWYGELPITIVILFVGIAILFVSPGLVPDQVTVPLDSIVVASPWAGIVEPAPTSNPLTNDTVKLFLPWMKEVREQLVSGTAPLWNPHSFSGYPLLGNGESAPWSPFFLTTLYVPLPKQIVAMAGLKIFVALLFTWLFVRDEGAGPFAAALAAVAFALSTYQTVYLYYSAAAVSSLLPAAAWSLSRALRHGAAADVVAFALVVAALLSSGHPESVLHVAVGTLILLAAFVASERTELRTVGMVLLAAGAGLLLSAPSWLPVLEQVLRSARLDEIRSGREMVTSINPAAAWALVNPDAFGNPARGNWSWIYNYSIVASSYVGLLVLALVPAALVGTRVGRRSRIYAGSAVVIFLMAMAWTPVARLNDIPPLDVIGGDKFRFVAVFFAAVAAALVVERLGRIGAAVALVTSCVIAYFFVRVWEAHAGAHFAEYALSGIAGLATFWLAATAVATRRLPAGALPAVAVVVTTLELLAFHLPFNAPVSERLYRPDLPAMETIRALRPDEPFRVAGLGWTLLPNQSADYGLDDVRGSDPMAWDRYVRFLSGFGRLDESSGLVLIENPEAPELDFLNVEFLFAPPDGDTVPGWEIVHADRGGTLYRNLEEKRRFFAIPDVSTAGETGMAVSGLTAPRASGSVTDLKIEQPSPDVFHLHVEADAPSIVASSVPALPGWRVEIDGSDAAILAIHEIFVGFEVSAGASEVTIAYRPASWRISVVACVAGLLLLAGIALRRSNSTTKGAAM